MSRLVAGGRQKQEDSLQELEKRVQDPLERLSWSFPSCEEQVEATAAELRALQEELREERVARQNGLQNEAKQREETCLVVLRPGL